MLALTRKEALALGQSTYFTGKPCIRGHLSEKYTSGYKCVECNRFWQQEHPALMKRAIANWQENNKERHTKNCKDWKLNNSQRTKDTAKIWRKSNKDKCIAKTHKRRALQNCSEGTYSESDIKRIFHDQFERCNGCNRKFSDQLKYTIDHIIPLSRGGSNWPSNIQLLCGSCNYSKGPKLMDEWLIYRAKI